MATDHDTELIKKVIEGDKRAFSQIVALYKNLVFSLTLRMLKKKEEAEEVAQDTFLKVYVSLADFKGNSKFSTWLYRIAYNNCLDNLKKRKLDYEQLNELTIDQLSDTETVLEVMILEDRTTLLKSCIEVLPPEDAALLTFFYFEEKNLPEIEKIMHLSVNTLKVRLHRARKKLAIILTRQLESDTLRNYG